MNIIILMNKEEHLSIVLNFDRSFVLDQFGHLAYGIMKTFLLNSFFREREV